MAKPDWGSLQHQFLAEHAKSGISPKDWCEAQGLNYASAKRYIKIANGTANSQKKTANKSANSQKGKASKRLMLPKGKNDKDCPEPSNSPDTKPIRGTRRSPPTNPFKPGNQQALKHGGYARRLLLKDEVIEDARALTLEDELFRLRASNLVAAENIGRWITMLEDIGIEEVQARKVLMENIRAAENAMMRNTVRIESITGTLATVNKIFADTDYRVAATDKVSLEADRLRRDAGIDDGNGERDLNDFYSDIQTDT
ncbi:hypothetical protein SAMN05216502_105410 [Citrobacter amalonaticus]|uniref:hypothetical protein n=1 Tax=Citrobacter amalonaticus TaxID=35703 RepID=UPI0008EA142D|nr:hypothetical protein [Citrobacter amalonaticus]SFB03963.1 hypothetical protein SAMN05216502_105410 [Citrobacter amalonaticus]